MKRLALSLLLALSPCPILAQSTPGFVYGQVPTAQQWNSYFAGKQDLLGYAPFSSAGGTLLGPLGVPQIRGSSGAPFASPGAGAGTGGSAAVSLAHDTGFELSVTTGTGPSTSSAIAVVTFSAPYLNAPHCVFSASNDNAGSGVSGAAKVHGSSTASAWTLTSGSSALTASTTYAWSVVCVG